MKSYEEWARELCSVLKSQSDYSPALLKMIRDIQLDGIKEGMTMAADVAVSQGRSGTARTILTNRDNLKELP